MIGNADETTSRTWHRENGPTTVGKVMGSVMRTTAKAKRPRSLMARPLHRSAAVSTVIALLLAGCADEKPLNTFEPRGPRAQGIDDLMKFIWPLMGIIFVAVIGGTIWLAIKNRVDGDTLDPEDLPAQTHGNTRLEIAWTLLPGVLLAVISVPVVANIWKLESKDTKADLQVMVIGQQWWWEYRYDVNGNGFFRDANNDGVIDEKDQTLPLEIALDPDDVVTANDLVIPIDRQVDLTITSRDVIHSFWIPRLNGKRDAVPGRIATWSVQADDPGKYTGWCTEFCGLSHARMRISSIALPPADFDTWLANQRQPAKIPDQTASADAFAGRELMKNQCLSCHIIRDGELDPGAGFQANLKSGEAPNLTHFATRSVFAGAIFNQYLGPGTDANADSLDVANYLNLSQLAQKPSGPNDFRWNVAQLKRWVQNAPAEKAMAPDDLRGMLAFPQLTDQQLNQIVAYLATLN